VSRFSRERVLRNVAGPPVTAALCPHLFSLSRSPRTSPRIGTGESALMREHYTPGPRWGLREKYVAQAFPANRPRPSHPSCETSRRAPQKPPSASTIISCAASGALRQSRTYLPAACMCALFELPLNLQRGAVTCPPWRDFVHVRKARRNVRGIAGRFGFPQR